MGFSNKNIIIGISISAVLASILYLADSDDVASKKSIPQDKTTQKKESKDIEILYLNPEVKVNTAYIKKKVLQSEKTDKVSEIDFNDEESIKKYIEDKKLINVSVPKNMNTDIDNPPAQRFNVYTNISVEDAQKNRDQSIPPPAPVMISGSLENGNQFTSIINGDVYTQMSEAIVTENDTQGNILGAGPLKNQSQDDSSDDTPQEESNANSITTPPSPG